MSKLETSGTIVTKDVKVLVTCPACGADGEFPIDDFDYVDLWYGQERFECENCGAIVRIRDVERD